MPDPLDDTWEYGVAARHLLSGDGFRTSVIHPPLWGLRDAALTVPVLVHGPLLPLLFAPALALLGAGALDQVAWLAALFALLTALLLCRLGTRHFGPAVGAAAALLFTLAPLTLRAVHHDVSVVAGAFLLLLAFDLLARERPRHTAAALVLGLGMLVRPEMALALVGLSMLAGGAGTVTLVLGMALVCGRLVVAQLERDGLALLQPLGLPARGLLRALARDLGAARLHADARRSGPGCSSSWPRSCRRRRRPTCATS